MHSVISLLIPFFLVLFSLPSFAIDPSSNLPIEIESDRATLDDQSGISTYSGNVIVSQGLSRLEAEDISVITKDRQILTIEATGVPAHFVQQDNAESPSTHGYGKTITYVAKENLVRFSGDAKLVQEENSFSGEEIEYDILRRAIKAKGDQAQGSRVKIHYYPQNKGSNQENPPSPQNETIESSTDTSQATEN